MQLSQTSKNLLVAAFVVPASLWITGCGTVQELGPEAAETNLNLRIISKSDDDSELGAPVIF